MKVEIEFRLPSNLSSIESTMVLISQVTKGLESNPDDFRRNSSFSLNHSLSQKFQVFKLSFESAVINQTTYLKFTELKLADVILMGRELWTNTSGISPKWGNSGTTYAVNHSINNGLPIVHLPQFLADVFNFFSTFLGDMQSISSHRKILTRWPLGSLQAKINQDLSNAMYLLYIWRESQPSKFWKVIDFIRSIDASIGHIRFVEIENHIHVYIAQDTHEDAVIKLENSGTGISQLLSFATLIEDNTKPRLFLVDEPQSFLHPQAESLLIALMLESPHQYVVASHSPVLINEPDCKIQSIVKTGKISTVHELGGLRTPESVRLIAGELGVSLNSLMAER
ncbi:MAG: ATP-binding protein, partial [Flavobacterium sp.]